MAKPAAAADIHHFILRRHPLQSKTRRPIVNKAAYMAIVVVLDGRKDVLGVWIGEHKSAKFWLTVLNGLETAECRIFLSPRWTTLGALPKPLAPAFPKPKSKSA